MSIKETQQSIVETASQKSQPANEDQAVTSQNNDALKDEKTIKYLKKLNMKIGIAKGLKQ